MDKVHARIDFITDVLFNYGAKYRLNCHGGKLVTSISYWPQDRKISSTTIYYNTSLYRVIFLTGPPLNLLSVGR